MGIGDLMVWLQYLYSCNKGNKLLRNTKCTYISSKKGQSSKLWPYFRHLLHHWAQTSFSLEDLDFTSDNLNLNFLSVTDKIEQGISFTNIFRLLLQ